MRRLAPTLLPYAAVGSYFCPLPLHLSPNRRPYCPAPTAPTPMREPTSQPATTDITSPTLSMNHEMSARRELLVQRAFQSSKRRRRSGRFSIVDWVWQPNAAQRSADRRPLLLGPTTAPCLSSHTSSLKHSERPRDSSPLACSWTPALRNFIHVQFRSQRDDARIDPRHVR